MKELKTDEDFKSTILHIALREMQRRGSKKTKPLSAPQWVNKLQAYGFVISNCLIRKEHET